MVPFIRDDSELEDLVETVEFSSVNSLGFETHAQVVYIFGMDS
jgi:hypothetical protein